MLKKTITYTDYNGVVRKETFYFNLTKAEILDMEMGTAGGFAEMLQSVVDAQDQVQLVRTFKEFILKAYGEKSADGKYFMKTGPNGERLADAFAQTEAYSELYMELATNADAASQFINDIVPADMRQDPSKIKLPEHIVPAN